jgi:phosphoglycolate phosphatase
MSRTAIELLAVDLDGTLVDSAPDIAHCLGTALAAVGREPLGEAGTRALIGDGLEALITRALAHADGNDLVLAAEHPHQANANEIHAAALSAFLTCYRDNLFVRSRLYADAVTTLDTLRERAVRLCCITNKRHAFAESLLVQAGVRDRFELLLGGDSLAEKKPSPLPLLVAAKTLGVAPSAAALVGDSHQDLHAAHAAGYRFVLASYGYGYTNGKVDAADLGTAPRIRSLAELPTALGL